MKDSLTRLGVAAQYSFDRPQPAPKVKVLNTFKGIKYVFDQPAQFSVIYDLKGSESDYGNMLGFDDPAKNSLDEYRKYYREGINERIAERSYTFPDVPGRYVDIVTDVVNNMSLHWAADRLVRLLVRFFVVLEH
ncbi:hypothetical protein AAF712_013376 [Marasmius tenuissimus]|uniref:Uncharacterized protein n=1 Tax=Marasmius tenuissimus TaxID=585030 RepID=A0ABR2ZF44_9AGAR